MQKAGFTNAGALLGGNMAWEAAGNEMVKAPPATPAPAAPAPAAPTKPAAKPDAKPAPKKS
ncbi:MAG: hypothetical protein HYR56_18340 [Acidobacteria bacterium]|nr:hypothetical protein [Acidobacteriota bacterium]MBI3424772.1 hypothetical protein [Acidobacteriota bacterium]